jgi:hypothetical protein
MSITTKPKKEEGDYLTTPNDIYISFNMRDGKIFAQKRSTLDESGNRVYHEKHEINSFRGIVLDDRFSEIRGINQSGTYKVESGVYYGANNHYTVKEFHKTGEYFEREGKVIAPPTQWKKGKKEEIQRLSGNAAKMVKVVYLLVYSINGRLRAPIRAKIELYGGAYGSYIDVQNAMKNVVGNNRLDSLEGFDLICSGMKVRPNNYFSPSFDGSYVPDELPKATDARKRLWEIAIKVCKESIDPYVKAIQEMRGEASSGNVSAAEAETNFKEEDGHPPVVRVEDMGSSNDVPEDDLPF